MFSFYAAEGIHHPACLCIVPLAKAWGHIGTKRLRPYCPVGTE